MVSGVLVARRGRVERRYAIRRVAERDLPIALCCNQPPQALIFTKGRKGQKCRDGMLWKMKEDEQNMHSV